MGTRKLTIHLPEEEIEFAKRYAARHGLTITQLIDRYLRRLQRQEEGPLHPDIVRFSGIIPSEAEGEGEDYRALQGKLR